MSILPHPRSVEQLRGREKRFPISFSWQKPAPANLRNESRGGAVFEIPDNSGLQRAVW